MNASSEKRAAKLYDATAINFRLWASFLATIMVPLFVILPACSKIMFIVISRVLAKLYVM